MDFFVYNNRTGNLEINEYELFLTAEFAALLETERNKCKEDPTGIQKLLARKELTYIYQKMSRKSPYCQYSEIEAHNEALKDSKLTREEFDDPVFRAACRKYKAILESNRIFKMLKAAQNKIDDVTDYFDHIVDLNERDNNGKPIFKLKDLQVEIAGLNKLIDGIKSLEAAYASEEEAASALRSDAKAGFRD